MYVVAILCRIEQKKTIKGRRKSVRFIYFLEWVDGYLYVSCLWGISSLWSLCFWEYFIALKGGRIYGVYLVVNFCTFWVNILC